MILREIPREFEAILFNGDVEAVDKFAKRHGGLIEFQTDDAGVTSGTLHTAAGTEKVTRGVWVIADALDQLSRIFPNEIGDRYEIIDPNAERLDVPPPVIPPEPKVAGEDDELGDDDDFDYSDLEETTSGLMVPKSIGPKISKRINKASDTQRINNLESKMDQIIGLLAQ